MNSILFALLCCLFLPKTVSAESFTVPSHCQPDEQVVFSCYTSKTKVVSLCSSPQLTAAEGYLQYRFGPLGKPELSYPAAKEHPQKHFLAGTRMYSAGGSAYLRFRIKEITYTVFTGVSGGRDREGVVVEKDGKKLAFLGCRGISKSEIGPDLFERLKIPRDPKEMEFSMPE